MPKNAGCSFRRRTNRGGISRRSVGTFRGHPYTGRTVVRSVRRRAAQYGTTNCRSYSAGHITYPSRIMARGSGTMPITRRGAIALNHYSHVGGRVSSFAMRPNRSSGRLFRRRG